MPRYYKRLETRLKHDKTRQKHLKKIAELEEQAQRYEVFSPEWKQTMDLIVKYDCQLKIYDEYMGYRSKL